MQVKTYSKDGLNFIELNNQHFLRATFCNLGASIYDLTFHDEQMVLSNLSLTDFKKANNYYGKTLGRLVGLHEGNAITINNRQYYLAQNDACNTLHGGLFGLNTQSFTGTLKQEGQNYVVEYKYTSMDQESGVPGTVEITIRYIMSDFNDNLRIEYKGLSDKDTMLNLSTLNTFTLNETSVNDLTLMINADKYKENKVKTLIPNDIHDVTNTIFDFRKERILADNILSLGDDFEGYDNLYLLNKTGDAFSLKGRHYVIKGSTSYDGLYFSSDNKIDDVKNKNQVLLNHRGASLYPCRVEEKDMLLKAFEPFEEYLELRFERF